MTAQDITSPDEFYVVRCYHDVNVFALHFKIDNEFVQITRTYESMCNQMRNENFFDEVTVTLFHSRIDDKYKEFILVVLEYMFIATVDVDSLDVVV